MAIFNMTVLICFVAREDYQSRGCSISADEIFVSDGAKQDSANIQEIFSLDNRIAVCDPVYPVYVDSNVMAGRCGDYDPASGMWSIFPRGASSGVSPGTEVRGAGSW